MKLIATIVLTLCLALPLAAQPSPEASAASGRAADEARDLMQAGDRRGAVMAALMGLPDAPDAADLAAYPEAHEMLFRAMASRIVDVERPSRQMYAVNADGTRAVVMGVNATLVSMGTGAATIEFDSETRTMVSTGGPVYLPIEEEPPHILVDPRTGEVMADLVPFGALRSESYGPAIPFTFSPDGRIVTAWHMRDGAVLRFDATDGSPLPPLTDLAGRLPGTVIGYSPDGMRIAAGADGLAAIWEATTGTLIETVALPRGTISSDWTHDNQLLTLQVDGFEPGSPVTLSIYRDGAWDEVVDLTGIPARPTQYMQASPSGPHVLLDAETETFLVNWDTGERVDLGPVGASFHTFVRDGEAVAVLKDGLMSFLSGQLRLEVVALDGSPLDPVVRDWVTFDQYVAVDGGTIESYGIRRPYTYTGDDLPDGTALWQAAMDLLTEAERAEVAAGRIASE